MGWLVAETQQRHIVMLAQTPQQIQDPDFGTVICRKRKPKREEENFHSIYNCLQIRFDLFSHPFQIEFFRAVSRSVIQRFSHKEGDSISRCTSRARLAESSVVNTSPFKLWMRISPASSTQIESSQISSRILEPQKHKPSRTPPHREKYDWEFQGDYYI
jgi:hypothetical protein